MNPSIFKAYDIRGIYPDQINEDGAVQIGKACLKIFGKGKIVVAHDIRHGSETMAKKVAENMNQGSNQVIFVGLSTTPMFYFLVNKLQAVGGCMITASHNPKNYNGFKIVRSGGEAVSGIAIQEIINTL